MFFKYVFSAVLSFDSRILITIFVHVLCVIVPNKLF